MGKNTLFPNTPPIHRNIKLGHENDPNLMLIYCKVSNMQYVRKRENGADSVQPINVIDIRQDIQI